MTLDPQVEVKTVAVTKYRFQDHDYDTIEALNAAIEAANEKELRFTSVLHERNYKKHKLDKVSTWEITDEGLVDFSSSARPKRLAVVHGTYENAIRHALSLDEFWGYGPGYITELNIIEV